MNYTKLSIGRTLRVALLGATALVAVDASVALAAEQEDNTDDASTTVLTAGNSAKFTAPAAGTDEIFTVADGVAVGDTGVVVSATTADGVGTLKFLGDSTATGTIGASGQALGVLDLNGTAKAVSISGDIYAAKTDFTGTTTLTAGGDINGNVDFSNTEGVLSMAADKKVVGNVDSTAGSAGTLTFAENTADVTLVSGTVGATNALTAVNVTAGAGTTAKFADAVDATTITVAGTGEVEFDGAVAGAVNISAGGTVDADATITGAVDNTSGADDAGTLVVADTANVTGAVGATHSLAALTVEGDSTIGGAVKATTVTVSGDNTKTATFSSTVAGNVNISNDATVAAQGSITGNVDNTSGADGAGTLTLTDGTDVSGTIGATNTLKAVTAAGDTAFGGAVSATTVSGGEDLKAVTFADDVTATTLAFIGDGTMTVAADKKIVGEVTSATDGEGTLTFAENTADVTLVSGDVGVDSTKALKAVNVTAGADTTATFGGKVKATTVTLAGTGTTAFTDDVTGAVVVSADGAVTVAADKKIVGSIDKTVATGGTLTFAGTTVDTTLVDGNVGATSGFTSVNLSVADTKTATFGGTIKATDVNVGGTGTVKLDGAVTGNVNMSADGTVDANATITGNVDNTSGSDGAVTLTVADTANVTGTVGATNTLKAVTAEGSTDFGGAVSATTVTAGADGSTTNFAGDVTGAVAFSGTGTIAVAANKKIVGAVTTATTNEGTLTFAETTADTTVVSGTVGTTDEKLAAVTVNAGAGTTATVGSSVYATTINVGKAGTVAFTNDIQGTALDFDNDGIATFVDGADIDAAVTATTTNNGTLTFAGTSDVSGDIGAAGTVLKAVNVGDGTTAGVVTLAGGLHATTTTVNDDGTLKFSHATPTVTGAISVADGGTLSLGTSDVNQTGALTLATGSTLKVTLSDADYGSIDVTGATSVDAAAVITPVVVGTVTDGATFDIITDDGTAPTVPTITDTARYDYDIAQNGTSLRVTVNEVASTALGLTGQTTGIYGVIDTAFAADTTLLDAINSTTTNAALGDALASLAPDVSGGDVVGTAGALDAALGVVEARTAKVRGGATGFSSGSNPLAKSFWVQGYGSSAEQTEKDGVKGYEASTYGIAAGVDHELDNAPVTLGFAFNYGATEVDNEGSTSGTDIDSYQGTIYGSYEAGEYFVDASLAYARNEYEKKRAVVVGAVNRTAASEFDGDQFSLKAVVGKPMALQNGATFVPKGSVQYTRLSLDGYTETGATTANLTVDSQDYDSLWLGLGGELSKEFDAHGGKVIPSVHAGLKFDVIGDDVETTSKFAAGTSFKTDGMEASTFSYNAGVGVTFVRSANFEFALGYDYEGKEDYSNHSGMVRGTWKF